MPHAKPLAFVALAVALLGARASADETYFTLGLAGGGFDAEAPAGCSVDDSSSSAVGGTAGVGFAFDERMAIEFGYISLGGLDVDGTCPPATPITVDAPDSGLQVSGVGRWGFDPRWAALGRIGAFTWSGSGEGGTELLLGAGAEYSFRGPWALRLEYLSFGSELDAVALTLRVGF